MWDIKSRNCKAIFCLNAECGETLFTWLPCWDEDCVMASSSWSNSSRLMSGLRPSATTVNRVADVCQPLLFTDVRFIPSHWMGSVENVRNCDLWISRTHIPYGLLLTTCTASDLFKVLRALTESTGWVVELFLIGMGMLRGSIFSSSLCIVATILWSPLLYVHRILRIRFFLYCVDQFFCGFSVFWVFFCIPWQNDLAEYFENGLFDKSVIISKMNYAFWINFQNALFL